jgi:hypothetical protein
MGGRALERKTVGELQQQLTDHLLTCEAQGKVTNTRLARIEGILIAVAGGLIMQLIGIVVFLVMHAYPVPTAQASGTTVTTTSTKP